MAGIYYKFYGIFICYSGASIQRYTDKTFSSIFCVIVLTVIVTALYHFNHW